MKEKKKKKRNRMYGKHYLWCAYVITFMKLRDIKADISINRVIIEILWFDFLPVNANHRQDGNQDSIWTRAGEQSHKIFVIYKIKQKKKRNNNLPPYCLKLRRFQLTCCFFCSLQ